MRNILLLALLGTVLIAMSTSDSEAKSLGFRDDFDSFDSTRWLKSDHVLGRTDLAPNNVNVRNQRWS